MRKLTLTAGQVHPLGQIPNHQSLSLGADGFPIPLSFTKKSSGAIVQVGSEQKKLISDSKGKLKWQKVSAESSSSAVSTSPKKKPQFGGRKPKTLLAKKKSKTTSKSDELLQLMLIQQLMARRASLEVKDTLANEVSPKLDQVNAVREAISGGVGGSNLVGGGDRRLLVRLNQHYQDLLKLSGQDWHQMDLESLEQMIESQVMIKQISDLNGKICDKVYQDLKKEVYGEIVEIKRLVGLNQYGLDYQNQLKDRKEKIQLFLEKFNALKNLCSVENFNGKNISGLYKEVKKIAEEIDQLSIANDFKYLNSQIEAMLNKPVDQLNFEEVNHKIKENQARKLRVTVGASDLKKLDELQDKVDKLEARKMLRQVKANRESGDLVAQPAVGEINKSPEDNQEEKQLGGGDPHLDKDYTFSD